MKPTAVRTGGVSRSSRANETSQTLGLNVALGASDVVADVSVIIVNYNTGHLLAKCLGDLRAAHQGLSIQTVIVDNASSDGSAALIRACFPDCHLIESGANLGFGRANNLALPSCTGRYLLLLNTDAFVDADAVLESARCLDAELSVGVVGARLLGADGSQQPSCRHFPTPVNVFLQKTGLGQWVPRVTLIDDPRWDPARSADCDWVPGCFLMIRRSIVDQMGLFDPRFFLYSEEVDLCQRVKAAGWTVRYLACARAVHIGGESAKSEGSLTSAGRQLLSLQVESLMLYFRKHYGLGGVIFHIALEFVAALALAARRIIGRKLRPFEPLRDFGVTCRLAVRTAAGHRPTR